MSVETWAITGAGSGIGAATAIALLSRGCNVAVGDVDEASLAEMQAKVKTLSNGSCITFRIDVSQAADHVAFKEATMAAFGRIDVVFLNAGLTGTGISAMSGRPEDWRWLLGVNFFGVQFGVHTWLPELLSQPHPTRIVATSSVMGLAQAGPPGASSSYGVSKHALIAYMEALHNELYLKKQDGQVQVSVLCPATVSSGIWDVLKQEMNRPDKSNAREMSADRAAGLKGFFFESPGSITPDHAAHMLFKGLDAGQFIIDTHPGMAKICFSNRAGYILASAKPSLAMSTLGSSMDKCVSDNMKSKL